MFTPRKITLWTLFLSVSISVSWLYNQSMANSGDDLYYKIDKGLHYLREVFETVSRNYVDELDPEVLSKAAIEGMLKEFDPYTVFFTDPGSQQMRMITRGKYGGVGMEISVQDRKVTVIAPMEGSPAKRAGIRAGDIITRIDGEPTDKLDLEEASRRLRGKIGTEVTVEIQRPGLSTPIQLTLTREEIVLKDITFADFIEPGLAYFRLSAFSDKAAAELKSAIKQLQQKGEIQRVILDLRGNPGGLLTAAVEVVNIFIPPGQLVVSTRGAHESENRFYTKETPLLPTQPLVVLVDESSASASEIVAGAIQDLDRGVLVGTRTFGKGLVQKVYPIDKISQAYLKITTAKYYVPSGRSIQKEDYKKDAKVFLDHSDSLEYNPKIDYFTQNRRVVHGGGGIHPDIEVENDMDDPFLQSLLAQGLFFRFTVDYLSRHPEARGGGHMQVSDAVLAEFEKFVSERDFDFEVKGEAQLDSFLRISRQEKYDPDIQDLVTVALQKLKADKQRKFITKKHQLRQLLVQEFAEKSGGLEARIRASLPFDTQLQAALPVLRNREEYRGILAIR